MTKEMLALLSAAMHCRKSQDADDCSAGCRYAEHHMCMTALIGDLAAAVQTQYEEIMALKQENYELKRRKKA